MSKKIAVLIVLLIFLQPKSELIAQSGSLDETEFEIEALESWDRYRERMPDLRIDGRNNRFPFIVVRSDNFVSMKVARSSSIKFDWFFSSDDKSSFLFRFDDDDEPTLVDADNDSSPANEQGFSSNCKREIEREVFATLIIDGQPIDHLLREGLIAFESQSLVMIDDKEYVRVQFALTDMNGHEGDLAVVFDSSEGWVIKSYKKTVAGESVEVMHELEEFEGLLMSSRETRTSLSETAGSTLITVVTRSFRRVSDDQARSFFESAKAIAKSQSGNENDR